jgi:hypothetical protein
MQRQEQCEQHAGDAVDDKGPVGGIIARTEVVSHAPDATADKRRYTQMRPEDMPDILPEFSLMLFAFIGGHLRFQIKTA